MKSARIPVLNSLLFIRDAATRDIPLVDGLSAVWSTASCLAVSCLPDSDGETEVIIGRTNEMSVRGSLLFDGMLRTPSRCIIVENVLRERILDKAVPSYETRVRVWTNGFRDTDKVIIEMA